MFAPRAFSVRVLAVASDRVRVVVGGELELATGPALRDALAAELDAGRDVMLDLASVEFIESSGLAVVVEAINAAKVSGRRLGISSKLSPSVRRLLDLAEMHAALPLVDD